MRQIASCSSLDESSLQIQPLTVRCFLTPFFRPSVEVFHAGRYLTGEATWCTFTPSSADDSQRRRRCKSTRQNRIKALCVSYGGSGAGEGFHGKVENETENTAEWPFSFISARYCKAVMYCGTAGVCFFFLPKVTFYAKLTLVAFSDNNVCSLALKSKKKTKNKQRHRPVGALFRKPEISSLWCHRVTDKFNDWYTDKPPTARCLKCPFPHCHFF